MEEYNFRVSCDKNKLVEVRRFFNEVLKKYSISEKEKITMILAVDEVCANLMIHSHNCNPCELLEVNIKFNTQKSIIIEITDYGDGFDIQQYKEPSLADIVRSKRKGGIGLMLVRRIMDKVEYIEKDKKNIYRLYKKLA